jgi:hypothetical protein
MPLATVEEDDTTASSPPSFLSSSLSSLSSTSNLLVGRAGLEELIFFGADFGDLEVLRVLYIYIFRFSFK